MTDLTSGHYPEYYTFQKLFGGASNANQSDVSVRSNAEWTGFGNLSDGALAATGVATAVAIPVEQGDVISKISIFVGATAEATGTHAWAALYSGIAVPALLAQSADNTGAAALGASARFDFTLQTAQSVSSTNAPNGFVYASIAVAAGTVPTAVSIATAAAAQYQYFTNGPLFLGATHGSALAATAPATIASPAAKAVTPIVVLS